MFRGGVWVMVWCGVGALLLFGVYLFPRHIMGVNSVVLTKAMLNSGSIDVHDPYTLRFASRSGYDNVVKVLLQYGAAGLDDALWEASAENHHDIVTLLLGSGADVHAYKDKALRVAAEQAHMDAFNVLVQQGADDRILERCSPDLIDATAFDRETCPAPQYGKELGTYLMANGKICYANMCPTRVLVTPTD